MRLPAGGVDDGVSEVGDAPALVIAGDASAVVDPGDTSPGTPER